MTKCRTDYKLQQCLVNPSMHCGRCGLCSTTIKASTLMWKKQEQLYNYKRSPAMYLLTHGTCICLTIWQNTNSIWLSHHMGCSRKCLAQVPFPVHETLPDHKQTMLLPTCSYGIDDAGSLTPSTVERGSPPETPQMPEDLSGDTGWAGLELPTCWDAGANFPRRYYFYTTLEDWPARGRSDGRLDPVAAHVRAQLSTDRYICGCSEALHTGFKHDL